MSESIDIYDLVSENYVEYGRYVNYFRAIPAIDGLKPSQRRVLIAAKSEAKNFCKTAGVVGEAIKKWHPHGSASLEPVISDFVRKGILQGQGNHGIKLMEYHPEAASRYTEVKFKPNLEDLLFKMTQFAPHFQNELGNSEPVHLITPVPIALVFGTSGIGFGCNTRIPAFTYSSLIEAYNADDPKKLKAQYGYQILHKESDLKDLWVSGKGSITYRFKLDYLYSKEDESQVTVITGSGDLFIPRLSVLNEMLRNDRIFIRDESKKEICIVVGRTSYTKSISHDQIYDLCLELSTHRRQYTMNVFIDNCVRTIGIREWLDKSISLYKNTYEHWKKLVVQNYNNKLRVFYLLPDFSKMLVDGKSDEEIKTTLNLDDQTLNDLMNKPMKMHRKQNFDAEIKTIKGKIKEVKSINVDNVINCGGFN